MYFEEKGEGFPLVLLHGNGEDHHYFDRQIDFFSRYYRVLAPDTPGHGLSPKGEGDFTLERFSRDLHTLLEEQKISGCHLLVHFLYGRQQHLGRMAVQCPGRFVS